MSRSSSWFVLALALALAACCPPGAAPVAPTPTSEPDPVPVVVDPRPEERRLDGGTFTIAVNGAPAGTEGFELRQVGDQFVLENHVDATLFGRQVRGHGTLRLDASGRPLDGTLTMSVDGVAVATALKGGPAALVSTVKTGDAAAKEQRAAGPVDLYIDDTSFAHLASLCTNDAATVVAFPGMAIKRGATREASGTRVTSYDFAGQVQIDLYCDGARYLGADIPIAGLTVTRDGEGERIAALRRKPREKPALPAGLVELDRTVDVAAAPGIEPAKLACTLLVPASHAEVKTRAKKGPTRALAGVTFITGSGSQDRDEDSYGPGGLKMSIFKTVAIELGKAGIVSLRCDDRGSGGSTGSLDKVTLETYAADATATLEALRDEPAVNPVKTGMVGHSEGGIIAPMVSLTSLPTPRALVLMAGTGRPFDVILQEQARRSLEAAGRPAAEVAEELAKRQAVFDAMRAGKPLPSTLDPGEAKAYGENLSWMTSHLRHDPAATAAKVKGVAVLIAQGSLDQQVAVADADALELALKKKNKVVEKIVYPGLNHLFAPTQTGDVSEYTSPDAQVDERFLRDVVRFLTANL